jgi:hypothetical protein
MPSITADTVNINYGNNSQVGTTNSNNGSSINAGLSPAGYTQPTTFNAPSGPISSSVNTGSYSVGSTSVLEGYSSQMPIYSGGTAIAPQTTPSNGAGGSYLVTAGQGFQAPSPAEYNATCAAGGGSCGAAAPIAAPIAAPAPAYNWNTGSSYNQSSYSSHNASSGYSFCGSDKVYNNDGALLAGSSPVCR